MLGFGPLKNNKTGLCLDTLQRDEKSTIKLGVFACQGGGSSAQLFSLTKSNQLRREMTCAEAKANDSGKTGTVYLSECSSSSNKWQLTEVSYPKFVTMPNLNIFKFKDKLMQNMDSGLCLDAEELSGGDNLVVHTCDASKETQHWGFVKTSL